MSGWLGPSGERQMAPLWELEFHFPIGPQISLSLTFAAVSWLITFLRIVFLCFGFKKQWLFSILWRPKVCKIVILLSNLDPSCPYSGLDFTLFTTKREKERRKFCAFFDSQELHRLDINWNAVWHEEEWRLHPARDHDGPAASMGSVLERGAALAEGEDFSRQSLCIQKPLVQE